MNVSALRGSKPCKRGHDVRNKYGQCRECAARYRKLKYSPTKRGRQRKERTK